MQVGSLLKAYSHSGDGVSTVAPNLQVSSLGEEVTLAAPTAVPLEAENESQPRNA